MLRTLGFGRGVIVHTQRYDIDHSLLIDELEALGPMSNNYRAIGIVRDGLTDRQMAQRCGRCARGEIHLGSAGAGARPDAVRRSMARARDRLACAAPHQRIGRGGLGRFLRSVKGLTMVIDHMGHLDLSLGLEQPAMRWILDRLQEEHWWLKFKRESRPVMRPAGTMRSRSRKAHRGGARSHDLGTDWPHTGWRKQRMMNDAEAVELLYRYVDHDPELIRKILVANPARLHGFAD